MGCSAFSCRLGLGSRNRSLVASNQGLAGVLSGVTKVAEAMEIDPARIYYQRTEYEQGCPVRRYYIASAFMRAAIDADWSSPHDLEERDDDDEGR
jgi:hypothetical protein